MSDYIKVLAPGRKACHGGEFTYPYRKWTERIDAPVMRQWGYHACTPETVCNWFYAPPPSSPDLPAIELWWCDVDEATAPDGSGKVVGSRLRLTRKIGTFTENQMRLLAVEFAVDVLHLYEERYPCDERPHRAIEAAWLYAHGYIDAAAWAAAWDAAGAKYSSWILEEATRECAHRWSLDGVCEKCGEHGMSESDREAAEEATRTPCPACAGTGRENDGDRWQQTPCVCQEDR